MVRTLKQDLADINRQLAAAPEGSIPFAKPVRIEDVTVTVQVVEPGRRKTNISIMYGAVEDYPGTGVLTICEDEKFNTVLETINDEFREAAPLPSVLYRIAELLELPGADLCKLESSQNDAMPEEMELGSEDDQGQDDNSEEEEDLDSDGDFDVGPNDDTIIEVLKKKSRWTEVERVKKEAEDAAAAEEGNENVETVGDAFGRREAQKRQIFNNQEAFQILAKELEAIMTEEADGARFDIYVDAVGDDVFCWDIWLGGFKPVSPLGKGMVAVQSKYGRSSLQMCAWFMRGLHPFYPPYVQLRWPRAEGPIPGALASHPMLKLSGWDPMLSQRALIAQLRAFLEAAMVVDVDHPRNREEVAYSDIELKMARLESLVEIQPRCLSQFEELYSKRDSGIDAAAMNEPKRAKKEETMVEPAAAASGARKAVWASGTGYGTGHRSGANTELWDVAKSNASQAAHDIELERLLSELQACMLKELGGAGGEGKGANGAGPSSSDNPSASGGTSAVDIQSMEESCLLPFLAAELGTASFIDMSSRVGYYVSLVQVLLRMCVPAAAHLLVCCPSVGGTLPALVQVIARLQKQAKQCLVIMESTSAADPGPSSSREPSRAAEEETLQFARLILEAAESAAAITAGMAVFNPADPSSSAPDAAAAPSGRTRAQRARATATPAAAPVPLTEDELHKQYCQELKPMQVNMLSGMIARYKYAQNLKDEKVKPRPRIVRVGKELASLNSDLPLTWGSSVFVCAAEENVVAWKVMITGPTDTPYQAGCFVFDVYFPPQYPAVAPLVNLCTTGGGKVRFNPNLYNCGKVCLSLLGTWQGDKGENWGVHSTVLQVLISIQSLILVEDPFYNEPGYESSTHQAQSDAYSLNIREQTMRYAILEQLKHPAAEFVAPIEAHFRLQRKQILETCGAWIAAAPGGSHKTNMETLLGQIKAAMNEKFGREAE